MDHVIEAHGLAKSFPGAEAVRGGDLTGGAGEIVGFLGPNGAGKTTTLRMLTTLLRPTAGAATVAGRDLVTDPAGVRRRIGYVAQGGSTNPACTALRGLRWRARRCRVPGPRARARGRRGRGGRPGRGGGARAGGRGRRRDGARGGGRAPPRRGRGGPAAGRGPQSRT